MELSKYGYEFSYQTSIKSNTNILLINFSKKLIPILIFNLKKIKLVLRLGTPFASHANLKASLLLKIRTWIGLKSIGILRRFFTDAVIYQSKFVKSCWEELYPNISADEYIIYNGVDVDLFNLKVKHKQTLKSHLYGKGTQTSPKKTRIQILPILV